jgi:hypothetical protein
MCNKNDPEGGREITCVSCPYLCLDLLPPGDEEFTDMQLAETLRCCFGRGPRTLKSMGRLAHWPACQHHPERFVCTPPANLVALPGGKGMRPE